MTTELTLLSRVAYRGREITGPRLRGLLALLASEPRTGCGTPRLVDGLWPDERPDNPAKALQVLVSRIRAQLGDGVVARTPTGYRLALAEERIDAAAVLLHAAEAARHARAGDHAAALREAEAGLALWEGAPAETGGGDPLAELRAERAITHRTLTRLRALALARLGRYAEAAGPLADLTADYPRDEELLAALIRAEAATQGPAAAMARYDTYRRALRDELGADPGPALRAVHQELLRDEEPEVRHGVAHEPNPLLGRDDDLAAVTNLLTTARVVSVVGPGGLGKTRFANAVALRAPHRTVHVVGLAGVAQDGDVAAEVASAISIGEVAAGRRADVVATIVESLGPGALLVLDNCEHVLAAAADLVATLVATSRELTVLATSRAPLGLSSESVYPLPELDEVTSEELFRQRARAARPGVDLPGDAVAALCRHLDGLPLAVELAAARVRVLSVPEINRRLADRFALLRGGRRDAPERHHTLQAVVDWSWQLLDADGQAALRALSVFADGFTVAAAGHVLGRDAFDTLEHLVDQSLLKVVDTPAGVRFRLLETVREFAAARLAEAGAVEAAVDGFLRWAREFGTRHHDAALGADPVPVAAALRAEQDNLVLAVRHGFARGDAATVACAGAVLVTLWMVEANYVRAGSLTGAAADLLVHATLAAEHVEAARTFATVSVINTLSAQGPGWARMRCVLRRLPPAPPDTPVRGGAVVFAADGVFGRDPAVLRALAARDEPFVAAAASVVLSYRLEHDDDLDGALAAARRLVDGYHGHERSWLWILAHGRAGELALRLDLSELARDHFTAAVRVLADIGAERDVVGIYWGMVLVSYQLGEFTEAERWLARATTDHAGSPDGLDPEEDDGGLTFVLAARAELTLAKGDVDAGLRLWRRAVLPLGNDPADVRPWVLETQAGVVSAHARAGVLEPVADLLAVLPAKLVALLEHPMERPPAYLVERAVAGSVLLALGLADIAAGTAETMAGGVRLIALAERLHYLRGFQPSMVRSRVREIAEDAGGPAYADAVSEYAGLDRDGLTSAALAAVRERVSGSGRG